MAVKLGLGFFGDLQEFSTVMKNTSLKPRYSWMPIVSWLDENGILYHYEMVRLKHDEVAIVMEDGDFAILLLKFHDYFRCAKNGISDFTACDYVIWNNVPV